MSSKALGEVSMSEKPKIKGPKHHTLQLTQAVHTRTKSSTQGFVEFIRTQGVVGLAIGFVIGAQAKALVDQLSNSFINPTLGLILGSGTGLTSKKFALTVGGTTVVYNWGAFAYAVINFIIIAAIIYFTFKWLRLDKLDKKKDKDK